MRPSVGAGGVELIPPASVDLDGAAARGKVEPVVSQGDYAAERADGDDGSGLADGAEEGLGVQVELALAACWEGLALPADGLLVGHDA